MHEGKFTVYDRGLHVPFMVRWPGKIQPGRTDALINFVDFVPTIIELAGGRTPKEVDEVYSSGIRRKNRQASRVRLWGGASSRDHRQIH